MSRAYKRGDNWFVSIGVVSPDRYKSERFALEGGLADVLKSLQNLSSSIPEQYRSKASCGIDQVVHYSTISASYERPATQEEIDRELNRAKMLQNLL